MRLDDGHATIIHLSLDTNIELWEKDVTPPGISGGGAIDTTTMRNTTWRTMSPKSLKTLTPMTVVCAYDPAVYESILAQLHINQVIMVEFPDGSTLDFWGIVDEFTPGSHTEGEQPTATVTIIPTNRNNANPPAEVAPVYLDASSTGGLFGENP